MGPGATRACIVGHHAAGISLCLPLPGLYTYASTFFFSFCVCTPGKQIPDYTRLASDGTRTPCPLCPVSRQPGDLVHTALFAQAGERASGLGTFWSWTFASGECSLLLHIHLAAFVSSTPRRWLDEKTKARDAVVRFRDVSLFLARPRPKPFSHRDSMRSVTHRSRAVRGPRGTRRGQAGVVAPQRS
nr:hypothetical protein CFP56_22017 [Quercus suber]